jgi:hypothetical protein
MSYYKAKLPNSGGFLQQRVKLGQHECFRLHGYEGAAPCSRLDFGRSKMRISTILMAATVALFGLSTASRSDEPDDHFDGAAAKLYSAGYKQVNLVDRNRQLFSAYDGKGSEVIIVVDNTDGNIVTVNYVHGADE